MSASRPWMKFYPRDWRGDQALRAVSLTARGLELALGLGRVEQTDDGTRCWMKVSNG